MATLPQITLNFNRKIKLSNDGGSLSSDTGEFLFREFDDKIGFFKTLMKHLKLKDNRQFYVHSNEQLLRQKMYQDRKSTRLNSSHVAISYAVFCLKKKKKRR